MDLNVVLPFLSSVLSFAFAALVADQWLRRRQPYQLVWTIGLLWYGISAGTEFLGSAFGWSEPLYRTWYLVGAFGVAAYLGLGTVYLLNRTRFGYFVAASFALAALFSFLTSVKYAREGTAASDDRRAARRGRVAGQRDRGRPDDSLRAPLERPCHGGDPRSRIDRRHLGNAHGADRGARISPSTPSASRSVRRCRRTCGS